MKIVDEKCDYRMSEMLDTHEDSGIIIELVMDIALPELE